MIQEAITFFHALQDIWNYLWGIGGYVNAILWVVSNFLVGYVTVLVLIFVVVYYVLWDPSATTGGKLIYRFMVSLIGVVGLVFISLFIDPVGGREWYVYPGDVLWWRPGIRFLVYAYISIKVTQLVIFLVMRKFWPDKIKKTSEKQPDEDLPLKERHIKR